MAKGNFDTAQDRDFGTEFPRSSVIPPLRNTDIKIRAHFLFFLLIFRIQKLRPPFFLVRASRMAIGHGVTLAFAAAAMVTLFVTVSLFD